MVISSQVLIDGIEGKLSEVELTTLVEQLRALTSSEVLHAARQAGINIRGDGNIVGNNNINIVIKDDLARILQDAFTHSHALHQLQSPVGDFVGRESETEQVRKSLRSDGAAIISGMGGIGKTELVLHTADQLRTDYPDGQLIV